VLFMISVRNLLQPSSGSKILILLLAFSVSSCGWFKKAPKDDKVYDQKDELEEIHGQKVFNPETGEYEIVKDVRGKMDTITWKDIPAKDAPPITSDATLVEGDGTTPTTPEPGINTETGSEIKSSYRIAVLLPFMTDDFDMFSSTIPQNSNWAVHFYAGMKLAFDRLEQEGSNFEVSVLDTKASLGIVENLLRTNNDLINADLIIGPYRRVNVTQVADFAKSNNITMVSPYSASEKLSTGNPNYLQVNPSLKTHCQAITEHVRKSHDIERVVLVAQDKPSEKSRFKYFQEANFEITGTSDTTSFHELVISGFDEFEKFNEKSLDSLLDPLISTAFIIPSWSDETFVQNFLRTLDLARKTSPVVVYGMPQWIDFQNIDYEYFKRLNVHVSAANYLDRYDPNVRFFRQQFYERYRTIPENQAFLGHDVILYFGRMLKNYGTKFQSNLELKPSSLLGTKFGLEPILSTKNIIPETQAIIEQYENTSVFILKYQDFFFQPAE